MNPLRGEVPLALGAGAEAIQLTLKMGINALCAAETLLGKKSSQILDDMEDVQDGPALDTVRIMVWAGLRKYHPEFTPNAIGDLMDMHGPTIFTNAILNGLASAFGRAEGKKGPNPPKPRRQKKTGTG